MGTPRRRPHRPELIGARGKIGLGNELREERSAYAPMLTLSRCVSTELVNVVQYLWRVSAGATERPTVAAGKRSMPDTSDRMGSDGDIMACLPRAEGIVELGLSKTKGISGDGNARVLDKTEGPRAVERCGRVPDAARHRATHPERSENPYEIVVVVDFLGARRQFCPPTTGEGSLPRVLVAPLLLCLTSYRLAEAIQLLMMTPLMAGLALGVTWGHATSF